jgi:hypothetical protein
MKRKPRKFACFLLLASILSSCTNVVTPVDEVTASNSPTITATFSPTMTYTASPTQRQATATWYLKTASPILPTPPPDDIGYYEGIIVITQYYTFLDHGLYKEAYQLLSLTARQRLGTLDEYIEYEKSWFTKLEIISIIPQHSKRATMNNRRFCVSVEFWDEHVVDEEMMSSERFTLYLTLVREDGEWKIDSFDTA